MLNSIIGTKILNGFCLAADKDDDNQPKNNWIDFNIENVYLGLLTVLPNNNEKPYNDGDNNYYFKEPTDPEYHRIKLTAENPLEKVAYISEAIETSDITDEGIEIPVTYVTNPTYIMFPETSEAWGNIAGFGLFTEETGTNLPYIWGTITGLDGESAVSIGPEEIPIIRANNFKISLR